MALEQITDHAARAVSRLAEQFKESTLLKGLLSAVSIEIQELEDKIFELYKTRDIDGAADATLDNLGALVGAPRRGSKNNTQYRNRVRVQVKANRSYGNVPVVYEIAKLVVAAWNVADQPRVYEDAHRGYYVESDRDVAGLVNDTAEAIELSVILKSINPAGVRGIVRSQSVADAAAFSFAGGPGLGFGAGALSGAYDGNQ